MVKNDFGGVNFDYITAIPPRRQRMKEIGFDQSGALAKKTAKLLSVKYYPNLFKRIRQTSKQTDLSSFERQQNLNGAFGLKGNSDNIQGKTILVIDDVTTTGATFNECARVLKLSGAKAVYCAAIATTEKNNGDRDSFIQKRSKANFAPLWWREMDSNHRSKMQQIYSLPPLATREPLHV